MKMIKLKNWPLAILALFMLNFISCQDDTETGLLDVENFSNESIEALQQDAVGKSKCLEFIFPISIQFIDESIVEVSSYEDLHESVSAWFEENGVERNRENKPQLVFPIQVVGEEGSVTDVASQEELRALRSECKNDRKPRRRGHRGKGFHCFELVFPVDITIDGVTNTFEDQESLRTAIKEYRQENGRDAERPALVFPVTIEYEDGSQVEIANSEELKAAKQGCREN